MFAQSRQANVKEKDKQIGQPTRNQKPTGLQISAHTLKWTKLGVCAAVVMGVSSFAYDHWKPAPSSISQTATSTKGTASNSVASGSSASLGTAQGIQQSATAQGDGDATNTVASGEGNATGKASSVATVSGNQVNVYSGTVTVNLNSYPSIPLPAKSNARTMVLVGRKKFPVATIRLFNQVQRALQAQHYQGSSAGINFLIGDDPSFAPGYNEYAIRLFVQGKYSLAEQEWKRAIFLDPTDVLYYNNLSQARSRGSLSVTPNVSNLSFPGDEPPMMGVTIKTYSGISVMYRKQGSFIVLNESDVPLYNIKIVDYAVSPLPLKNKPRSKDVGVDEFSRDGFPLIIDKNFGPFTPIFDNLQPRAAQSVVSIFGTNTSLDSKLLRVMEKQVTFSRRPHGPTETLDFKFVLRRNAKKELAWFPQI